MLRLITLLIVSLTCQFVSAQDHLALAKTDAFRNPSVSTNQMMINAFHRFDNKLDESKLFVFSEWSTMEVYGINDQYLKVDSANVFIAEGKVLFYSGGELQQVFGAEAQKVIINGKTFIPFIKKTKSSTEEFEFYEVVVDDAFKLLKKWSVKEELHTTNPMGIIENTNPDLVVSSRLYYVDSSGELKLLPKKKKAFIAIFGRNKSKMIDFIESKNLSVKEVEDVKTCIEYYNSLLTVI